MIEIYAQVSYWIPPDQVYVFEQYLNKFYVISHNKLTELQQLAAVSKYLYEAKERPKYHNLHEQLLSNHQEFDWLNAAENRIEHKFSPLYRGIVSTY